MAHGDWHDRWGGTGLWWIGMAIVMAAFWGGLIWFAIAMLRRDRHSSTSEPDNAIPVAAPPRPDPEGILAERLARGEIDPDDYRQRLDALQTSRRE